MTDTQLADVERQVLLRRKFGNLLDWQVPLVKKSIGPFDPDAFEPFNAARRDLISKCVEKLQSYSDVQITDFVNNVPSPDLKDWRSFLDFKITKLSDGRPPWYAAGLGHADHQADYEYWGKMNTLTLHELMCLSVGVAPESFKTEDIAQFKKKDANVLWPALQFLLQRHEQLQRQFDPYGWTTRVDAREFLQWTERIELDIPEELTAVLRRYAPSNVPAAPADPVSVKSEPLLVKSDKREVDSIAQLFTAMTMDDYGYDPAQKKSPIPKEIADMAASLGISISTDTVLKYLRIGARFIPKDRKAPDK